MLRLLRLPPNSLKLPALLQRRVCTGLSGMLLTLALSSCSTTPSGRSDNLSEDTNRVPRNRLQQAVQEYCREDARETAQYLLTQGTPHDVELLEQAVGMLDTGEWLVIAEIIQPGQPLPESTRASADETAWKVAASCSWKTPFPDLDGRYEFELEIVLGADGARRAFRLPTINQ